jgi:hypothetical protein
LSALGDWPHLTGNQETVTQLLEFSAAILAAAAQASLQNFDQSEAFVQTPPLAGR